MREVLQRQRRYHLHQSLLPDVVKVYLHVTLKRFTVLSELALHDHELRVQIGNLQSYKDKMLRKISGERARTCVWNSFLRLSRTVDSNDKRFRFSAFNFPLKS